MALERSKVLSGTLGGNSELKKRWIMKRKTTDFKINRHPVQPSVSPQGGEDQR